MSIHPEPKVRISGLFGLAGSTHDPFIRDTLLQAARKHPEPSFSKEDWARVQSVLAEVSPKFPLWRDLLSEIYGRWQREPLPNRIRDMGDYNWERMANAAAAQALLLTIPLPKRNVQIKMIDRDFSTQEILQSRNSMPALNGLQSGNGTGFQVIRTLIDTQSHSTEIVYPATITVRPETGNSWILKGTTPQNRDRAFAQMLNGSVEMHFGHLESLVSLLKYKLLRLEPPADYYASVANFQNGLRAKLAEHETEMKRRKIRFVPINEIRDLLSEETIPNNLIPFPAPTLAPVATEEPTLNESVFVASLESVYAARALAVLGEKITADHALISLLPKAWKLTSSESLILAKNLETGRDDGYVSADLDDASKKDWLGQVFQGLTESLGSAESRRVLIRWVAGIKDVELAEESRKLLSQNCGRWLSGTDLDQ